MIKQIENDFNLYKNFYYVAMTGSFSKAAEELYISQPSVSYNIKCLEQNLNCKLFIRKQRGIELTDDGKTILEHIENAYNSILLAEKSVIQNKSLNAGSINIGGPSFILNKFIVPVIEKFTLMYPNIKIKIICKPSIELLEFLKTNRIDILIDTLPIPNLDNNINIQNLLKLKTCFASSRKCDSIGYIFPDRFSDIGKRVWECFISNNIVPQIRFETNCTEIMEGLCEKGLGIGFFMEDYIKDKLRSGIFTKINVGLDTPLINVSCLYIKDYLTHSSSEFIRYLNTNLNSEL